MNKLWIRIWDVGRGNAISLALPNNKLVMIDAGASEDCSPAAELKNGFGYNTVDTLVITHPHTDHMIDLETIIKLKMGPTVLIRPKWVSQKAILDGNSDKVCANLYVATSDNYTGDVSMADDIYRTESAGGVMFKCYSTSELSDGDLNNASIVHLVEYCGKKILFPGDCTIGGMKRILEVTNLKHDIQGLTILVAPHHGHKSCYCSELMQVINPSLCIVSEGHGGEEGNYVDSRYSDEENVSGMTFVSSNGSKELRRCITTRTDGNIDVVISSEGLKVAIGN